LVVFQILLGHLHFTSSVVDFFALRHLSALKTFTPMAVVCIFHPASLYLGYANRIEKIGIVKQTMLQFSLLWSWQSNSAPRFTFHLHLAFQIQRHVGKRLSNHRPGDETTISEREYEDSNLNDFIISNWHNFEVWPNWNLLPKQRENFCRTEFNKLSIQVRLHVRNWVLKAVCEARGTFNNSILFSWKRRQRSLPRFRFDLNSNQLFKAGSKFMQYQVPNELLLCPSVPETQKCKVCAKN